MRKVSRILCTCVFLFLSFGNNKGFAEKSTKVPEVPGIALPLNHMFATPNGDAYIVNDVLIMTDGTSQRSSIWSKEPISLRTDFTFETYIYFGNEGENSADGMTFSLIDAGLGQSYLGDDGAGMGMYRAHPSNSPVTAISLEFDTYENGDINNYNLDRGIEGEHIAFTLPDEVRLNGYKMPQKHHGLSNVEVLSDGSWKKLIVNYRFIPGSWLSPNQGELSYQLLSVDDETVATGSATFMLGLAEPYTPGNNAYWGFTASTGDFFQTNAMAIVRIPTSPQVSQAITLSEDEVSMGESFQITIKNKKDSGEINWLNVETTVDLTELEDFEFVSGSAKKNGLSVADPEISNYQLTFSRTREISNQEEIEFTIIPKKSVSNVSIYAQGLGENAYAISKTQFATRGVLQLIIPSNVNYGGYDLNDKNNSMLHWPRDHKVKVLNTIGSNWKLSTSITSDTGMIPYLRFNENKIVSERQFVIANGTSVEAEKVISDDWSENKGLYVDYGEAQELREDTAVINWILESISLEGIDE
ncbi:hypothetical protein CBR59_30180 [Bacillus thuringiensis]|uniref:L-type lectin-domain containing protein n=1 Tax=Bacillus thuringiensis TaxID=1428 RepID=UPI000C9E7B4D|nr:L-type lectin-domain containing protein [Bacillus thuringiensis]PNK22239.1 hypothetical protein CBP87_32020 [Bacillus thuringiensis]PNK46108.1 hypothetical protein CBR59_30180 [Bacillus thuringiensis]